MVTVNATTDYRGKSTDPKPTDADINALFLEVDTTDFYYFDVDEEWHKVGGAAENSRSVAKSVNTVENLDEPKEGVRDEPLEEVKAEPGEEKEITEPEPETRKGGGAK